MKSCPKCETTRRPGLKHCHGCQFQFSDVMPGNEKLISSFADAALGVSFLIASVSTLLHGVQSALAFLGAISGSNSLTFEKALTGLAIAFGSYVVAVVLWRVLNLPKS